MSPEKQRIAIAETCGWEKIKPCASNHWGIMLHPHQWIYLHHLPDYLNDLNAMHEVENGATQLKESKTGIRDGSGWTAQYQESLALVLEIKVPLCDVGNHVDLLDRFIGATAAQRAEAFLRTIGKWEES